MPLTACRNSFWFGFYDCLKMAEFGPRTGIFFFFVVFFFSQHISVHHISVAMRPRLTKFGMQLPYGITYAYIFWIFEFPIFRGFLGIFLKKNLVFQRQISVHHISVTIRPRLTKFGMQLPCGITYAYIFWIFEFPIFRGFLGIFLRKTQFFSDKFRYIISPSL